jgi:hypothetical protein
MRAIPMLLVVLALVGCGEATHTTAPSKKSASTYKECTSLGAWKCAHEEEAQELPVEDKTLERDHEARLTPKEVEEAEAAKAMKLEAEACEPAVNGAVEQAACKQDREEAAEHGQ